MVEKMRTVYQESCQGTKSCQPFGSQPLIVELRLSLSEHAYGHAFVLFGTVDAL